MNFKLQLRQKITNGYISTLKKILEKKDNYRSKAKYLTKENKVEQNQISYHMSIKNPKKMQ